MAAVAMAAAVLAAAGPGAAEPYEDGGSTTAGSRYSNTVRPGWMTASAQDRIHDIAQIGNRIYLAGAFRGIRYGTRGRVSNRAFLIAVDADSGRPLWSFAPRFNGPVYTLAVSGDGRRLYAGGAFTTVDGRSHRRLVALAPGGRVDEAWQAQVAGGSVRSIVATNSYLYVGGNFQWVNGAVRGRLARLYRRRGRVDPAWIAQATGGAVLTLEMPPGRDRLYVGGRFDALNGWGRTERLGALRTQDGRVDPGFDVATGRDVFDLLADGRGRVWAALDGAGGRAEVYGHGGGVIRSWDTDGDVQTVERIGDKVFFGGHELVPNDRQVALVSYDDPRGWDTSSFRPNVGGGDGVWALHADGDDLWVGAHSRWPFTGFGRFAAR